MPKFIAALLILTLAPVCRGEEPPWELVRRLHHPSATEPTKAIDELLRMGERARPALEGYLDPARSEFPPAPEAQRATIAHWIARLGHASYRQRQRAGKELTRIGYPAARQLAAATRTKDLQVRTSARLLLDRILPPAPEGEAGLIPRVRAALLLATVGSRASIPVLRRLLAERDPTLSAVAGLALRAILGGGPQGSPDDWRADRQRLSRLWASVIEAGDRLRPRSTGPETRLEPLLKKGQRLKGRAGWFWTVQPWYPGAEWPFEAIERSLISSRIDTLQRLRVTREFLSHERRRKRSGRPWRRSRTSLQGRTLVLRADDTGRLAALDAKTGKRPRLPEGLLPPGELLPLDLPVGAYRPGTRRTFGARRTMELMTSVFRRPPALQGCVGHLTYLARIGERDLYGVGYNGLLTLQSVVSVMHVTLQGQLMVDRRSGRLLGYRLSGPVILQYGAGRRRRAAVPQLAWVAMTWQPTGRPASAGADAVGRLIADLAHPEPARQVKAAAGLRALGEQARVALERVVSPPVTAAPATVDELIAGVGTPRDMVFRESSEGLIGLGRQVLGPLQQALIRSRGAQHRRLKEIARRLSDIDAPLVTEALRLLADLGDRRSLPALRLAALAAEDAQQEAATMALRALSPGELPGPAQTTLQLQPEKMLRLPGRMASQATIGELVAVDTRARYRVVGAAIRPLRLTIQLTEHGQRWTHDGRQEAPRSRKGQTLELRNRQGAFSLWRDGKRIERYVPLLLPIAPLLLRHLPQGVYVRHQARALPAALAAELLRLLSVPTATRPELLGHGGRITYVGRAGRIDRYRLYLRVRARSADGNTERSWLSGRLEVDPAAGTPVRLALSGPTAGTAGKRPVQGKLAMSWVLDGKK